MTGAGGPPVPARPGDRPPRRVKVVLADRRGAKRVPRTLIELEEQTKIGEELVKNLVNAQLRTSVLVAATTLVVLCTFPMLFRYVPNFADASLFGIRLPWLLLGAVPFPLLIGAGKWYSRRAERHERDFINMVEN
ncbi:hypothetical protein D5S17_21845 [Pseudonocardiaceae bacterium YIM PH 21723]|nr:hypothetical protein D5S17_21845 [Pseudonocardiaceae bacterium YIM PH 21723]